jgi:tetratricopeptide (TPR) repeat protein
MKKILTYGVPILLILVLMLAFVAPTDDSAIELREGQHELEESLEILNSQMQGRNWLHYHRRADILFRLGRFEEAIEDYEKAIENEIPHTLDSCWELGLAQYYAGDFRGGKEQFARYNQVGPLDIENGIWQLLCVAEEEGMEKAIAAMPVYEEKVRPPFPALLDLYLGAGTVDAVLDEATQGVSAEDARTKNLFYAHYYIGKYYDITDQKNKALIHLQKALEYPIEHFMYACAAEDARRLKSATPTTP